MLIGVTKSGIGCAYCVTMGGIGRGHWCDYGRNRACLLV